jgi:hypothetical protein
MNGTQKDSVSKARCTRKRVTAAQGPKPAPAALLAVLHTPRQPVLQASRRVDALIFQVQVNVRCSARHDDLVQMRFARPIEIRLKDSMNVHIDTWEECKKRETAAAVVLICWHAYPYSSDGLLCPIVA